MRPFKSALWINRPEMSLTVNFGQRIKSSFIIGFALFFLKRAKLKDKTKIPTPKMILK